MTLSLDLTLSSIDAMFVVVQVDSIDAMFVVVQVDRYT